MMSGSQLSICLQNGDHRERWLWPILISLPVPGTPGFRGSHGSEGLSGESLLSFPTVLRCDTRYLSQS